MVEGMVDWSWKLVPSVSFIYIVPAIRQQDGSKEQSYHISTTTATTFYIISTTSQPKLLHGSLSWNIQNGCIEKNFKGDSRNRYRTNNNATKKDQQANFTVYTTGKCRKEQVEKRERATTTSMYKHTKLHETFLKIH